MVCRRRPDRQWRKERRSLWRNPRRNVIVQHGRRHAATSGRCRAVIDNQRHLAPATDNIECFPSRKSIYVPLGVVRPLSARRRVEIFRRVSFSVLLSFFRLSVCVSVRVRLSVSSYHPVSWSLIAVAAAHVKYKMPVAASSGLSGLRKQVRALCNQRATKTCERRNTNKIGTPINPFTADPVKAPERPNVRN